MTGNMGLDEATERLLLAAFPDEWFDLPDEQRAAMKLRLQQAARDFAAAEAYEKSKDPKITGRMPIAFSKVARWLSAGGLAQKEERGDGL